ALERGRIKRDGDGNSILDAKGEPVWEPGLLKSVKAVGWVIPELGTAQVSINLTDLDVTPLHLAFDTCDERARDRGLRVTGSAISSAAASSATATAIRSSTPRASRCGSRGCSSRSRRSAGSSRNSAPRRCRSI